MHMREIILNARILAAILLCSLFVYGGSHERDSSIEKKAPANDIVVKCRNGGPIVPSILLF